MLIRSVTYRNSVRNFKKKCNPIPALIASIVAANSVANPWLGLRLSFLLAVIACIIAFFLSPCRYTTPWLTAGFAIVFMIWIQASLLWAQNIEVAQFTAATYTGDLLLFIALLRIIQTRFDLVVVSIGFFIGCAISLYDPIFSGGIISRLDGGLPISISGINSNYLGFAYLSGIALCYVLQYRMSKLTKLLMLLPLALLLVGIWYSGSRSAVIGLGLMVYWLLTRKFLIKIRLAILMCGFITLTLSISFFGLGSTLLDFESGAKGTGDWNGRLSIWAIARELWAANPMIGVGAGGVQGVSLLGYGAHMFLLEIGASLGIVGVVMLCTTWASAFWSNRRSFRPEIHSHLWGFIIIAAMPGLLTGMWDGAPAAWISLGIFTRMQAYLNLPASTEVDHGKAVEISTTIHHRASERTTRAISQK